MMTKAPVETARPATSPSPAEYQRAYIDFLNGTAGSRGLSPAAYRLRAQPAALLAQHAVSGGKHQSLGGYLAEPERIVWRGSTGRPESRGERLISDIAQGKRALHIPGGIVLEVGRSPHSTLHVMHDVLVTLPPDQAPLAYGDRVPSRLRLTSLSEPSTQAPNFTTKFEVDVPVGREHFNAKLKIEAYSLAAGRWARYSTDFGARSRSHQIVISDSNPPITLHIPSQRSPGAHVQADSHVQVHNQIFDQAEWGALVSAEPGMTAVPVTAERSLPRDFESALFSSGERFKGSLDYPGEFRCGIAHTSGSKSWIAFSPYVEAMVVFCPALSEERNSEIRQKLGAVEIVDHNQSRIDGAYRIPTDGIPNAALRALRTIAALDKPISVYEEQYGREVERFFRDKV